MIVYWVREKEHTDIYTQGYVGITSKPLKDRIREHRKNKKRSIVAEKLRKSSDLVWEIVHECEPLEEALRLEALYRSGPCIGWNLQSGGELGVEPAWYVLPENRQLHSEKTSEATRRGIANKDTKEARSERAKLNWSVNRKSYEGVSKGDTNPRAILSEADVSLIKYYYLPSGMSGKDIARIFNVKPYVISFIKTGKNWGYV